MQPLPAQTDAQDLRVDPRLPLVFDAKTARAYGYSRGEINHLLRSTRWSAVRRGLYCETVRLNAMGDVGRHAAQVLAALQVAGPNAAASRWSAAVLHGLPAPRQVPNHVSLVAPTGVRRQRNGMSVAVAALPPSHIDGQVLRLTSIARTVVDVARHASFIDAVMVADAALYRRLVSKEALYEMVEFQRQWPGVAQARDVVVFADARAESPLESRSRVRMHEVGLPQPELQVEILDPAGRFIGRADFCWPRRRTLGEVDGKVKYASGDPKILFDEKLREDALRDQGWELVRWTSADVEGSFWAVEGRLRAAFARGGRRHS
jgi:predicted transcriptional regulator of viral defense system